MRSRMLVAAWGILSILASGMTLAAKPESSSRSKALAPATPSEAEKLVEEALLAEAAGNVEGRAALLEQALEADPKCVAAHWHRGEVLVDGQWSTIEAATKRATTDGKLFEYHNRRNAVGDSAAEQLALAEWCRQQGLPDQLRVHALRALSADPAMAGAREALGIHPYNGRWLTEAEIMSENRHAEQEKKAAAAWIPRIRGLARTAASSERAQSRLRETTDPAAIPAIERVLSTKNSNSALAAVAILSNMKQQAATASLVRHAVLSPWKEVRAAAAEALRPRSIYGYAPLMLAGLEFPVEVEYAGIEQGIGSWNYRCRLFREGPLADTALDNSLIMQRTNAPISPAALASSDNSTVRATALNAERFSEEGLRSVENRADGIAQMVEQVNARATAINERIGAALAVATADSEASLSALNSSTAKGGKAQPQNVVTKPRELWQWWYDYNDIFYTNARPVSTSQQFDQRMQMLVPHECFVAGTPVWTPTGPLGIDLVQRGDLVLAQHPETGEVAYKAVLDTTVRPATGLLRVSIGDDELVVTKGHPLWVSGKGWRMARELEIGDRLHTPNGALTVTSITAGPKAEAYNLVVDGFNTFFAGTAKILAHDNNLREPTDTVVPGLATRP